MEAPPPPLVKLQMLLLIIKLVMDLIYDFGLLMHDASIIIYGFWLIEVLL